MTLRIRIPKAAITVPNYFPSMVRFKLKASASENFVINKMYVEHAGTLGAIDGAKPMKQMKASQSRAWTVTANTELWTDWIAWPWDKSADIILSLYANGGTGADQLVAEDNYSGANTYYKYGEASTLAPTSLLTAANYLSLVTAIEMDGF